MTKKGKVRRVRVYTRLTETLRDRVTGYCAASGIAERAVFEAALGQYIDGTSDMTLVLRRLDRLGRAEPFFRPPLRPAGTKYSRAAV